MNLVLIQPFGANSVMLKELVDYANEFFNVYFVDLPGFIKELDPLEEVTVDSLADFVGKYINDLNLDEYIIGGISLGFLVLCHVHIDKKCKGVLAVEPCLGHSSIRVGHAKKILTAGIAKAASKLDLADWMLHSDRMLDLAELIGLTKRPPWMDLVREHMSGKAIADTAYCVLTSNTDSYFSHLPHALIMNAEDETVSYEYVVTELSKHTTDLLIVRSELPHSPRDWSRRYFEENFPHEMMEKMQEFFYSRLYKK